MTASAGGQATAARRGAPRLRIFCLLSAAGGGLATFLACGDPPPPPGSAPVSPGSAPVVNAPTPPERIEWNGHRVLPTAQLSVHQDLLASRNAHYVPADGGGSARLLEATAVMAGGRGRFAFEYQAGPLGIAPEGILFFQVSPFWGWDPPQTDDPDLSGFTTVTSPDPAVTLESEAVRGQGIVRVTFPGRGLQPGERVEVRFGDGPQRARADRYAEGQEFFYFWVDGDGDGTRRLIGADVSVSIGPRPASDFVVWLPSTARPGTEVALAVAFLDPIANAAADFVGEVELSAPAGLEIPERLTFVEADRGSQRVLVKAVQPGIYRVTARLGDAERISNPLWVDPQAPPLFWGDLHGHSTWSDGSATPEEYYRYARDFSALDVAVLTDHDHYGMRKLDETPELWQHLQQVAEEFHAPGRFVTLCGYEWTSWLYGHRHVLYFAGPGPLHSCLDESSDTPAELWHVLSDRPDAITVAHHTGGGPVSTDWSFAPPPEREPVVEISSVHGSSESMSGPQRVRPAVAGSFVVDALALGYRLGFVGSGDSHDGHPGLAHRNAMSGGLAAIMAPELSREAVLGALRSRSVYATSGPRILLQLRAGDVPMGGVLPASAPAESPGYSLRIAGTGPLRMVELIKNGVPELGIDLEGRLDVELHLEGPRLEPGDYLYVRVRQEDGALAWSSPIWRDR